MRSQRTVPHVHSRNPLINRLGGCEICLLKCQIICRSFNNPRTFLTSFNSLAEFLKCHQVDAWAILLCSQPVTEKYHVSVVSQFRFTDRLIDLDSTGNVFSPTLGLIRPYSRNCQRMIVLCWPQQQELTDCFLKLNLASKTFPQALAWFTAVENKVSWLPQLKLSIVQLSLIFTHHVCFFMDRKWWSPCRLSGFHLSKGCSSDHSFVSRHFLWKRSGCSRC